MTAGPLAFDGERLYVVDRSHTVAALDPKTGARVWAVAADSGTTESTVTYSGCVVALDLVVCGDNGDLLALRRTNGQRLWRYSTALGAELDGQPAELVDSTLYTTSWIGDVVHAIDVRRGVALWATEIPGLGTQGLARTAAADGHIVAVPWVKEGKPRTGGVAALGAADGAIRWNTPIPRIPPDSDAGGVSALLWQDLVLVSANSGRIFAMDRQSGAVMWSLPGVGRGPPNAPIPNREVLYDYRAMVVIGSRLYASSAPGWLVAYDLDSRTELWRTYPGTADCDGQAIVTDGNSIYVPYFKGAVVVFSPDGKVRSIAGKNELFGPATLGSDRFFVGGLSGVYAFLK